jgi:hypothetical protein
MKTRGNGGIAPFFRKSKGTPYVEVTFGCLRLNVGT